jgi:hypothetical protein
MGRPTNIPIVLPPVARRDQPITAEWANQVRTAIDRLKTRGTIDNVQTQSGGYVHPYKIFVNYDGSDYTMQMQIGRFTTMKLIQVSSNFALISADQELAYDSSAGAFRGDDFDTNTLGEMALSASTTYGVWVTSGVTESLGYGSRQTDYDKLDDYRAGGATVRISSTYTLYSDAATYAATFVTGLSRGQAVFYIGQIETGSAGESTVKQWRKSDITFGNIAIPDDLHFVSTDANNSITVGSDKGAYYDAP